MRFSNAPGRPRSVNLQVFVPDAVLYVTQEEARELDGVFTGAWQATPSDVMRRALAAAALRDHLAPLLPVEHVDELIRLQTAGATIEIVVDARKAAGA